MNFKRCMCLSGRSRGSFLGRKVGLVGLVILVILATVLLDFGCARRATGLAGIYVDDGSGRTVGQRVKREIESKLLDALDLPTEKPTRMEREARLEKRSTSRFLYGIYNSSLWKVEEWRGRQVGQLELTEEQVSTIHQSDVIVTFGAHNPYAKHQPRDNRGRRIWFNVSELPPADKMLQAELRLYRPKAPPDLANHTEEYSLEVYRVSQNDTGSRQKLLVDSTKVTARYKGWIRLDVSEALRHWLSHPQDNRGLFIGIYRGLDLSEASTRPSDFGISDLLDPPEEQPFMVAFFKNPQRILSRRKRGLFGLLGTTPRSPARTNPYEELKTRGRKFNEESCNVRTLYLSFKQLGWEDWVIAPPGFQANFCAGTCLFPFKLNATNHAIVRTLLNFFHPEKNIPLACCAPQKLSSTSVLYYQENNNVVLKKYNNIIVDTCACH